jgi:hypothetical protein
MNKLIARIGITLLGAGAAVAIALPASASTSFTAVESSSHVLCSTFTFAPGQVLTIQGSGKAYDVTSVDGTCAFVNLVLPGHAGTILHGEAS